jgi:hypothetical protein
MREEHDPEWYLRDTRIRHWIRICSTCNRAGIAEDAPPRFHGRVQLDRHLGVLKLDPTGRCSECASADESPGPVTLIGERRVGVVSWLLPTSGDT